ncbi:MAG: PAS domain S-box protein, partial [Bacteroidales bacterium]|nr:PAS domain S-box protein [Bacteroidales bacterium]MCF8336554.1 PAS domain S-box protein [Bacteroidales bacterium]
MAEEKPTNEQLRVENQKLKKQLSSLRQTKKRLEEEEENYQLTLNSIGDGVITIDVNGLIRFMNPVAEQLTGWSEKKAKNKKITEVFEVVNAQTREKALSPVIESLKSGNIEWLAKNTLLISNDGTECQIADSASPIRDKEGDIGGVVLVFRDVSEYYRLDKALATSDEKLKASCEKLKRKNETLEEQKEELIKAKEKAEESKETAERYLNIAAEIILSLDLEGNITLLNDSGHRLLGYEKGELIGKNWFTTCLPEESRNSVRQIFKKLTQEDFEEVKLVEGQVITKTGERKTIQWHNSVLRDKNQKITGILTSGEDITERKETERQLEKSENIISALLDNLNVGVVAYDAEGILTYFNKKTREFHGLPRKNIPSSEWADYYDIYKEDGKTKMNTEAIPLFRALRGEYFNEIEMVIKPKEGSAIFILASGQPLKNAQGNITGAVVAMNDITERKQAEEELQIKNRISNSFIESENESFYKEILDIIREVFSSEYGFFGYINEDGDLVSESMTRDVWDKCQTKDKSIVFPKESWAGVWGDSLKKRKALYKNKNLQLPEGHIQLTSAMAAPIIANDQLIGLIAVANKESGYNDKDKGLIQRLSDYIAPLLHSKRKEEQHKQDLMEAKQQAEESNRLKSAFLANMSHEIRTPMNGILGFTDVLRDSDLTNEEKDEFIEIIHKSGQRMMNTVNDIVEMSKIEAGIVTTERQETNLNNHLKDVIRFFRPEARKKGLELKLDQILPEDQSTIITDVHKFEAMLSNLIKNAIKYTDKGRINVGAKLKNEFVEFYVKDTGIGVP